MNAKAFRRKPDGISRQRLASRGSRSAVAPSHGSAKTAKVPDETQNATGTLNDFVVLIMNGKHQLKLPTVEDFQAGSVLREMWMVSVDVTVDPQAGVADRAESRDFSFEAVPKISAKVRMEAQVASSADTSSKLASQSITRHNKQTSKHRRIKIWHRNNV